MSHDKLLKTIRRLKIFRDDRYGQFEYLYWRIRFLENEIHKNDAVNSEAIQRLIFRVEALEKGKP